MIFSEKDIQQIQNKGLTVEDVESQIAIFEKGLPFVNLNAAATLGNGILKLSEAECDNYIEYFNNRRHQISFIKFVPASGAATRMFKFLYNFLRDFKPDEETINAYVNRKKASDLSIFFVGIKNLPFYYKVKKQLYKDYPEFDDLPINHKLQLFIETMLDENKLDYGNFPKGLIPFHQYKDHTATAFEEHLFESALYASSNNKADLHFTISEAHQEKFNDRFNRIKEHVEKKTNTKFNVSYSFQKQSTDTIAVSKKDEPFRQEDGSLLFRPSGHGALLSNLNQIDADVIFVKNIDNIVTSNLQDDTAKYKMMLAGVLLKVQEEAFKYYEALLNKNLSEDDIFNIANFISNKLNVVFNNDFEKYSFKYQIEYLRDKLDRPIRVCGMVKNEGEPGGGPFWVKDDNGNISLQIVESSQIDKKNKHQKEIFKSSTHFNPVDLVCGVKNYKGETYDLSKYVDKKAGFITKKTVQGQDIKALELPGLWNGSMAKWNTIFVEVPLITFTPVKTVNDLLKDSHQAN